MRLVEKRLLGKASAQRVIVLVYCGFMIASGVVGLIFEPSYSLVEVLGLLSLAYSVALVLASLLAFAAIFWSQQRLEVSSFIFMALLSVLHAIIIFFAGDPSSYQTAWRLLASSVGILVIADLRWQRGISKSEIERHLLNLRRGSEDGCT